MGNNSGVPAISHHFTKVKKSSLCPVTGKRVHPSADDRGAKEDNTRAQSFPDREQKLLHWKRQNKIKATNFTQDARYIFPAWKNVGILQIKHNWSILLTCWENSGRMEWLSWKHMCCHGNMVVSMTTNKQFHLYTRLE